jgi:hypothetical protein
MPLAGYCCTNFKEQSCFYTLGRASWRTFFYETETESCKLWRKINSYSKDSREILKVQFQGRIIDQILVHALIWQEIKIEVKGECINWLESSQSRMNQLGDPLNMDSAFFL